MNLPNKLSLTRILLVPVMMFLYMASFIPQGYGKLAALVVFIIASITDLLDGKIARKYNLITDLGKFLDSIADKILTFATLFLLMTDFTIPHPYGVIFATIVLFRDFAVLGIKSLVAEQSGAVGAEWIGKVKFFVSTIAYPFGILVAALVAFGITGWVLLTLQIVFYVLIGATAVLTIWSGIDYMIKYKSVFKIK
ncbi:MAG: CDP-diacylglycerol--glycerol-3-phosphate 3-phosphatidyltransferase [Clostridia bacterium]|nr:CDP-diacylglycerol--glycerol-3-phosphate 3-phosphatidyltransferase [Clostridia bacterium]